MADSAAEPQPSMEEILAMIRRNITDDGRARVARLFGGRARNDILDLTEAIAEDGTVRRITPGNAPAAGDVAPPSPAAEPAANAEASDPGLHVAAGGRTLEDLVGDILRPLLQAWLDANLPGMVERLLKAELAERGPSGR